MDFRSRAQQKQASRDQDAADLLSGKVTPQELQERNGGLGMYLAREGKIDWSKSKLY